MRLRLARNRQLSQLGPSKRHLDREDRARTQTRANIDLVPEQVGKALHDGETETQAFASFPCRVVELMEFFKDRLELQLRDAVAGIPDLDAEIVAASPAAEEELALGGVFHRVRHQIADDLLEEAGIAAYGQTARDHPPLETFRYPCDT